MFLPLTMYIICISSTAQKGRRTKSYNHFVGFNYSVLDDFSLINCRISISSNREKRGPQSTQRPLSDVHSIMMEKLAHSSEVGGCTPIPFHYIYHHVQSCGVPRPGTLQLRGQIYMLPLLLHYPYMFSVGRTYVLFLNRIPLKLV